MMPPGALDEICAPMNAPGIAPISSDVVMPNDTCPYSKCPRDAAATSGTACTRSVPTSCDGFSAG